MRLATRVIAPSEYLVDVFSAHGVRASSIPNFVDFERFSWRIRRPLRPVFLSNRNFEAHYDVPCVLRAFSRIQAAWPEARLMVVGDGPKRDEIHALGTELGLQNVEFLGRVEHGKMPELYDRADIFLNTPLIDNMPNSILEAYACGLPVVTTDAGGIPYILEDEKTGLMVSKGDDRAVAEAALRILENPDLAAKLAEAGKKKALEEYSWERAREDWRKLYRKLAGREGEEG
jgi:glycosyltransferase involved in cell wall biosynthesis